ncbi:MAG TPA: DUF1206 domain-containing protein [Allosphingosinicella sp.]|jgi:hypothetical protein
MLSANAVVTLTRVGFASRGIMYLTIGYLALRSGRTEDGAGALAVLSSGAGEILLYLMALGFWAYGFWRLSEAAIDSEGHGSDAKGKAVRAGGAISGLIHFGLGVLALKLAGGNGGGGGGDSAQSGAATVLDFPLGGAVLMFVAAGLLLTGIFQLVKAVKAGFLRQLDPQAAKRDWVKWLGRAGYAARGVVFITMGWFLFQAAVQSDAGEAGGMAAALDSFPDTLSTAVAAGLLLFGLFSFVEARFRRINDPKVLDRLKAQVS